MKGVGGWKVAKCLGSVLCTFHEIYRHDDTLVACYACDNLHAVIIHV